MRGRALATGVAAAALCATLAACFDLFHSTSGIRTACELDAATDGCEGEAGAADFCSWSPQEARANAAHACAWLGACETPMGRNAFGPCQFAALLAYDCASNPNHPVRGVARAMWQCLANATTCADVDACVFPTEHALCSTPGDYTACIASGGNGVRTECTDGGGMPLPTAHGESCALWGQTCASEGAVSECAGAAGEAGVACTVSGCNGSSLHWCDSLSGADIGIDCAANGAGACGGFPSNAPALWVACLPESDGGACTPDASASCVDGVAYSCPSGVPERIDCASLLGVPIACASGPLSPSFDWTSPCVATAPACTEDSCSGSIVTGCARGAEFTVDCAQEGLGPCRILSTDMGSQVHAACTPP